MPSATSAKQFDAPNVVVLKKKYPFTVNGVICASSDNALSTFTECIQPFLELYDIRKYCSAHFRATSIHTELLCDLIA